jgi:cytochrome c
MLLSAGAGLLLAAALGGSNSAAQSPPAPTAPEVRGKRLFLACQSCHAITAGAAAKPGPTLHKLFGRKAGAVTPFSYSPSLRRSNIVWTEKSLDRFIEQPGKFIPGTTMSYQGMAKPEDRQMLIAYLRQASQ